MSRNNVSRKTTTALARQFLAWLRQRLPRVILVWKPVQSAQKQTDKRRRAKAVVRGDLTIAIQGSANRSKIFAAHTIHVDSSSKVAAIAPLVTAAIGVVIVALVVRLNQSVDAVQDAQAGLLEEGSSAVLDIAVLPLQAASGQPACQALAQDISARLAQQMQRALESTSQGDEFAVKLWGPAQIRWQAPAKADHLDQAVTQLAEKRRLDVVTYGVIACDGAGVSAALQFHTSPSYLAAFAPEMAGAFSFDPINAPAQFAESQASLREFERKVEARVETIIETAKGISYYAQNRPESYLKASEIFARALASLPQADARTKAILHYMLSNAYVGAASDPCGRTDLGLLRRAKDEIEQSLAHWSQFAPAHITRSGILLAIASQTHSGAVNTPISDFIKEVEQSLDNASAAEFKPAGAFVEERIAIYRAYLAIIKHDIAGLEARTSPLLDAAESSLQLVLDKDTPSLDDAVLVDLAARAHAIKGHISHLRENPNAAIEHYTRSLQLAQKDLELKSESARNLTTLFIQNNRVCEAAFYAELGARTRCEEGKLASIQSALDLMQMCRLERDPK